MPIKKIVDEKIEEVEEVEEETSEKANAQKEELLALYEKLKELGITRIADLENKIAQL